MNKVANGVSFACMLNRETRKGLVVEITVKVLIVTDPVLVCIAQTAFIWTRSVMLHWDTR